MVFLRRCNMKCIKYLLFLLFCITVFSCGFNSKEHPKVISNSVSNERKTSSDTVSNGKSLLNVTIEEKKEAVKITPKFAFYVSLYEKINEFHEGVAPVKLNGKWGYINKEGETVIPFKYDGVNIRFTEPFDFSEGLAAVLLNGKWGCIDKDGKEVIPFKYDESFYFSEGLAKVLLDENWGYIDKEGKTVIPSHNFYNLTDFQEGLACVMQNGKYGYIDKSGKVVIPFKYDKIIGDISASFFREGLAFVCSNDKYGYINKEGKEITPFKYDAANYFSEGLAAVKLEGKYGYIDKEGKEVIPFKYDVAYEFSEGLAAVELEGKYGYINKEGKEITPFKYDAANYFSEGLAAVKLEGKYGYIDKEGKEVIPFKYDVTYKFSEGLAAVELDSKWGYIDKRGKEIIFLKYDRADSFSEGLAVVQLKNQYGFVNQEGNDTFIPINDEIIYDYVEKQIEEWITQGKLDERVKDFLFTLEKGEDEGNVYEITVTQYNGRTAIDYILKIYCDNKYRIKKITQELGTIRPNNSGSYMAPSQKATIENEIENNIVEIGKLYAEIKMNATGPYSAIVADNCQKKMLRIYELCRKNIQLANRIGNYTAAEGFEEAYKSFEINFTAIMRDYQYGRR